MVLAISAAPAQTLTEAGSVPVLGHTETRTFYADFSTGGLTTTGTGNIWDLSAATPFGASATVTYTAAGDSPYAASYPGTTLCMHRDAGGPNEEWRHFHVDASIAELLGANTDAFDGGRTLCTFPFSMGSTFTDTYSINGGSPYTETDTYVASGQLVTPWGTVPDVVMVSVNAGFSYYFYSADNVLDAIGTYTPGFGSDLWRVEENTGIDGKAPAAIGIWPVPAHGQVTLALPFSGTMRVEVLDASGRQVLTTTTTVTTGTLNLASFIPGSYMVRAVDMHGDRAIGRLLVQ
ncbi:MAG: T9SS type A sorting domain-containing protein [Flavobacteriales bacterium]|nr:T9SS type A sorting domain-containing protein [Flavobacteriales bacterium]MBK7940823.1 T9SS type A sorting domain-containing protein [Flavobacteriales bacterium]MBK8948531.1 T9SS type A sorting domain-containing protein [Flavobacteriales bacterium]MBK9700757.1 T9SS type A sorting domain-containing protein [Flavobacteriales bacterium]